MRRPFIRRSVPIAWNSGALLRSGAGGCHKTVSALRWMQERPWHRSVSY
jgi:hypothetical protein